MSNHTNDNGSRFWRSFEELHEHPESFERRANEFMSGVADGFDPSQLSGVSRRQFLALMGASAAVAGAGCDWRDNGELVPYNKKPENTTPGIANFYSTTLFDQGQAIGVKVKTREGRPIKIDGNPDHPVSAGKIDARSQNLLMEVYDPERIRQPLRAGKPISWESALSECVSGLSTAVNTKKRIALVTKSRFSPTQEKLFAEFAKAFPGTEVFSYELFDNQSRVNAWEKSYGGVLPAIDWEKADVVVALEADILGVEGDVVEATAGIMKRRDITKTAPENFMRLYAVESQMSLTGTNADYRIPLRAEAQKALLGALINAVSEKGIAVASRAKAAAKGATLSALLSHVSQHAKEDVERAFNNLVHDLIASKGKSIVYAGDKLPEEDHILVNALNAALGNSALYLSTGATRTIVPHSSTEEFASLTADMKAGKVGVVIHLDSNPAYHLMPSLEYCKALSKVGTVISLVTHANESSAKGILTLPAATDLESWGDAHPRPSFYSLQQPVLKPMYETRQKEDVLLGLISGGYKQGAYGAYLKKNWQESLYKKVDTLVPFAGFWTGFIQTGVARAKGPFAPVPAFKDAALSGISAADVEIKGFGLILTESHNLYDGRYANIGWAQELPHPISKIVWDNYAAVSVKTADKLGIKKYAIAYDDGYMSPKKNFDMVRVTVNGQSLDLPALVVPGSTDETIAIQMGYGRTAAGTIAQGDEGLGKVGFNANALRSTNGITPWLYTDVKVEKLAQTHSLISTQEHHAIDPEMNDQENPVLAKEQANIALKRDIILEGTVGEYIKEKSDPKYIYDKKNFKIPIKSINDLHEYPKEKWAMAINLNTCTGCNACVSSCNIENNIPVVGKAQVAQGREMHWMRIDRYFSSSDNAPATNPNVHVQPMMCQQCDNAPCENVCPVAATVHSPDGLNDIAYNRCVGTRYCANNCPYKVRRFNYYDFRNNLARDGWIGKGYYQAESAELVHNPEVTVRSRGVVEKCSFCVQRIMEARQIAKEEKRSLRDGDITVACQESCPADAIVFGDMNDPESSLSRTAELNLGYKVLDNLNVRPNVTYLARLRNIEEKVS